MYKVIQCHIKFNIHLAQITHRWGVMPAIDRSMLGEIQVLDHEIELGGCTNTLRWQLLADTFSMILA